ncbi:arylsulfatase [Aquipseudomonas alcaligenes]|uniref:sulfatase-like hydrolase/transferase n=1 Tax=Aquipseudomonas alcaligenes TaxID=43263 RepID=UPI0009553117|nr:sulfatase-like hydrolase/transferase [Pseudomonas alcaligenes]SIR93211.1 arylsulfatase [Pseudomonas alcaligenes]
MSDESSQVKNPLEGVSRRSFLGMAGVTLAASVLPAGASASTPAPATKKPTTPMGKRGSKPNVLFIFTDQERFSRTLHNDLGLTAHQRLMASGTTFTNHYCPAVMCTSSRAVLLTGLQTSDNGMFENVDMPYVKPLSTDTPTIGHMLRKQGYYTAYKGKWHLNRTFDTETPERLFTQEMDAYGFSDFVWPGDVLAHTLGGYKNDQMIAGSAISWLRGTGRQLTDEGKPWSLFVSLVNPHDIMYFNTDVGSEQVQDNGKLMMQSSRAPRHALYDRRWPLPLAATRYQSLTSSDRPKAHYEFDRAWSYTLGRIPNEDARWHRFNDFYYNSLLSVDSQVNRLLDELAQLGLEDNTIVVFTSDHGEMGGAHGLRGKGPFAYEESIHVPLIIRHPDVQGGGQCVSLTSHIDLVPSLLSFCGASPAQAAEAAGRELPGRDIAPALNNLAASELHTVREQILFTYSGIATNDSELTRVISEGRARGVPPKVAVQEAGYRPNLKKRGSLRSIYDGRHKFTRYFSPIERNTPTTLEALRRWNDLELFDLHADPLEKVNLAAQADDALLIRLNQQLNTAIAREMGADDGREMPDFQGIDWAVSSIDL